MLIYTSGTTGPSKGVACSHGALLANIAATTSLWRWSEDDVLLLALPLFHIHGLGLGILGTLIHGMTTRIHPRFEAERLLHAFAEDGASIFMGVPTMYARLLAFLDKTPDKAKSLAHGRLFTSGSAALPASDWHAFERLTGHRIVERYGMSETGFTLSNPYDGTRQPGRVGKAVPGYEVRVVNETGELSKTGDIGEIIVRGNGMMQGYWKLPETTERSFRDGWFLTGDLATVDVAGYHRIVGRKSVDIIKSGGFKISAREIEDVLAQHPQVAEVAIIGIPDPLWGEAIAAAVVLKENQQSPSEAMLLQALARYAVKHLAHYKKPRTLKILGELPRNALGKIQKHRLKDIFVDVA
jgi:acyl-CoA synthetase (AMP-forming)/AMP-acid ligase II